MKFQIEEICDGISDDNIRQILSELPKGLNGTYSRCLKKIVNGKQPLYAFNALRWVSHAKRPLRVEELEEAIAFDPKDVHLNASKRPNISIVRICANLVIIDEADNIESVVRLAHHTVKEFLEKPTEKPKAREFLETIDRNQLSSFNFGPNDLDVGEYCISYVFTLEFRDCSLPKWPEIRKFPSNLLRQKGEPLPLKSPHFDQNKYKLLPYAKDNWASHTSRISKDSLVWEQFQILALQPEGPWAGLPSNPDNLNVRGFYPQFQWAIENEHPPLLQALKDEVPDIFRKLCKQKVANGGFPLHVAVMKGNMRVAEFLLADKVKGYSRGSRWRKALHQATAAMRLLPDPGVDIEAKTKDGWTVLCSAAANGRDAVVRLLLEAGADIDAKAEDGQTVLHLASANGHDAIVQFLLEAKVDVKAKDKDGLTALHSAAANGHEAVVRLLIKKIDINVKDNIGATALHWAAMRAHRTVTSLLLDNAANIETEEQYGGTPLAWAIESGSKGVVELLLNMGAEVDYLFIPTFVSE